MTTTGDSSCDDDARSAERETRSTERERAAEALTEALEADELTEKDYHIREALQLVTLNDE